MKKILFLSIIALLSINSAIGQIPSVKLKNIDGKTVDTSKLSNNGKPFVISFFALWCKPCLRELAAIHEVYPDWQKQTGMKLIAVSQDQGQDSYKVAPKVYGDGWEFEVLLDPNGELKQAMGVSVLPTIIVVDGKGKIVSTKTGYTDGAEKQILEEIKQLLK